MLANLFRHLGDVEDFDEYRFRLPEPWCPMVIIIGSVQPYNNESIDPSEPRRFTVKTSAYDTSTAAPVYFSVACFLENTENTNRWKRVKMPLLESLLSITAKVAG